MTASSGGQAQAEPAVLLRDRHAQARRTSAHACQPSRSKTSFRSASTPTAAKAGSSELDRGALQLFLILVELEGHTAVVHRYSSQLQRIRSSPYNDYDDPRATG